MKKLLGALAAATLAITTPAVAQHHGDHGNHGGYEQHYGDHHRYERHHDNDFRFRIYSTPRYYNYDLNRRGQDYYSWHFFAPYPSYTYGLYCPSYRYVVVNDPYTGRRVCMPRDAYEQYQLQLNIRL